MMLPASTSKLSWPTEVWATQVIQHYFDNEAGILLTH
jgi:hypothetical protein